MGTPHINQTVLMSGADYFSDHQAINPYMRKDAPIDVAKACAEHDSIQKAVASIGIKVVNAAPPAGCQDGVYTANWALIRGDKAVMSVLPSARKGEESYAAQVLRSLGKRIHKVPEGLRFSGQGDALACGNYLFAGNGYRSDLPVYDFIADTLGYEVIRLQTIPKRTWYGSPAINAASGWPDSFFYDIDLALAVLRPNLIAWCPGAFMPKCRSIIRSLLGIEKIEIPFQEAKQAFASNLISSGEAVVMSNHAPVLQAAIEAKGLHTITPEISELAKGGGYIRCTTLTLDNE